MSNVLFVSQGYGTPCWVWSGTMFREGYGCFTFGGKAFRAHRVYWAWENGYDPVRPLDHLCHDPSSCEGGFSCPHRRCVNPDHLKEVTQRDNVIRGTGPSAANAAKTHCDHGHAFDAENTYIDPKTGWRQCRTCRRETVRRLADADRDLHNAKRRARRQHITYDTRPCQCCGLDYQPMRSDSRFCTRQACINERQRSNRNNRLGR